MSCTLCKSLTAFAAILLIAIGVTSAQKSPERLLPVEIEGRWGFIDTSGHLVIGADFDFVWGFSEGFASVWKDGQAGYVDESGGLIVVPQFHYARGFSEGLAAVEQSDKWGYVNTHGTLVIPPRYKEAQAFSEGLAAVQADSGLWSFVDKNGIETIKPQFSHAWSFREHVAPVYRGKKCGFIDANGTVVVPFRFNECAGTSLLHCRRKHSLESEILGEKSPFHAVDRGPGLVSATKQNLPQDSLGCGTDWPRLNASQQPLRRSAQRLGRSPRVVFFPDSVVDGGTTSCRVDQLPAVLYRFLFASLTYAHYALANRNLRGEGRVGGGWLADCVESRLHSLTGNLANKRRKLV